MGAYNHNNPSNRIRARRLLDQMMPRALDQAGAKAGFEPNEASELFKALQPHIRMECLDGVHVYRTRLGGWHADITLKGLPAGLPRVLGTPAAFPCSSREEAENSALAILALIVGLARENDLKGPPGEAAEAAFAFEGVVLRVPIAMLEALKEKAGLPDEEYVLARLSEIRQELTDRPWLDLDVAESLGPEAMTRLHAVAAMALLAGIPRWPLPEDLPPIRNRH